MSKGRVAASNKQFIYQQIKAGTTAGVRSFYHFLRHPWRSIKKYLPKTLLGRSLVIIITPVIVLEIVLTVVFYERHWDAVTKRLSEGIAGEIAMLIDNRNQYPGLENWRYFSNSVSKNLHFGVTFLEGETLTIEKLPAFSTQLEKILTRRLKQIVQRPFTIDTRRFEDDVQVKVQLPEGVLVIAIDRSRLTSNTTYIFLLWMIGVSFLLFSVAIVFMRNQITPIRRLARAMDNFGKGRDTGPFVPRGATEFRQAAAAFNRMQERIQRQMTQRTEMLAGVSHDLRTPLTRMRLQLAMMPQNSGSESLQYEVGEMQTMIEAYLDFARGQGHEEQKLVDLAELIADITKTYQDKFKECELKLPEPLFYRLRPQAFRRCLRNLLDNAYKYGKGKVVVRLRKTDELVILTIDDNGPGIPVSLREEALKPFRRLDTSRNQNKPGVGLGLSIVRDIIHGHGGQMYLKASSLGGLRIIIHLPL